MRWEHPRRGIDPAVRFHSRRRKLRPDRPARPVRHAAGGRRSGRLAKADRRRAAVGFGQPVQPAADPPRPRQRRPLGAGAVQSQAALLPARTDRIAGDGQSRTVRPCADQAQAARHRPVARRFRHRLFVAVLSDALPLRHDQDRQELSSTTHRRSARCCIKSMVNMAHELGLSVVAEGISDESDALRAAADGLRICAELHVRPARSPATPCSGC